KSAPSCKIPSESKPESGFRVQESRYGVSWLQQSRNPDFKSETLNPKPKTLKPTHLFRAFTNCISAFVDRLLRQRKSWIEQQRLFECFDRLFVTAAHRQISATIVEHI